MTWRDAQDRARLFITTITVGEAWLGLYRLPRNHADYESIKEFITNLPASYRVLKYDLRAAAIWGELTAIADAPLPLRDSFIGAIARSRGYHVVTRDVAPFERMGCKVLSVDVIIRSYPYAAGSESPHDQRRFVDSKKERVECHLHTHV